MPNLIGRFEIIREIGKGSQGAVYLANDPHLQRQVALKTLRLSGRAHSTQTLLDEARIVGQLQHPNIIGLFDAIEHQGLHYLVFEYVEGQTLLNLLQSQGVLEKQRAIEIIIQLLEGISYAHGKQVIHRDIKPANVVIDANNIARIMDFGIACTLDNHTKTGLDGTLRYMAPERFENKPIDNRSDIFSIGAVLYEMLTGQPVVSGNSLHEIIHKLANITFQPPSAINSRVDPALDRIVLKALAKKIDERYAEAATMKRALEEYNKPRGVSEENQSTLDFLLRRMKHKSDFPALSESIRVINRVTRATDENMNVLSDAILKDFSLTNKLLRLVNSVSYGQFGGTISTISRAVMILGFDAVRNMAMTLMLFEHLQNKAQATDLKDVVAKTYLSGVIAKKLAEQCQFRDTEQGFICAMFFNLGKLLTTFYFHEEAIEISKRLQQSQITEEQASKAVLGISYEELGIGVAKAWNFPDIIIGSMRDLDEQKTKEPQSMMERLHVIAGAANTLRDIAVNPDENTRRRLLKQFNQRFGESFSLDEGKFTTIINTSVNEFLSDDFVLNQETRNTGSIKNIKKWTVKKEESISSPAPIEQKQEAALESFFLKEAEPQENLSTENTQAILSAGIQDITTTLVGSYDLNSILRMIIETMYRGIGFNRVLLCLRDMRANTMQARFGLGNKSDQILRAFTIPLAKSQQAQDVFQVAIEKKADIFIADTQAQNIRERIPEWYNKHVAAKTFIVLPIVVDNKSIGIFYADKEQAGSLVIEPHSLNLLKTLRSQAVLAIRQK